MKKIGIALGTLLIIGLVSAGALLLGNEKNAESQAFTLVAEEKPVWDFEGSYEASIELREKAEAEIQRLKDLKGTGEFSDYDLEIGIAQYYALLGEGKKSYEHLLAAIEINDTKPLAYANLGVLLAKVDARESAKKAYEMALDRNDTVQNRIMYIQHLEQHYADDLDLVESAHTFAIEKFPESQILKDRYENWKDVNDR